MSWIQKEINDNKEECVCKACNFLTVTPLIRVPNLVKCSVFSTCYRQIGEKFLNCAIGLHKYLLLSFYGLGSLSFSESEVVVKQGINKHLVALRKGDRPFAMFLHAQDNRTGWCRGNALDLYPRYVQFEFRPGYWLSCRIFFLILLSQFLYENTMIISRLCHNCFKILSIWSSVILPSDTAVK